MLAFDSLSMLADRIYWIRLKNTLIRLDIGRHARQMQYIRRANSAVTVYHRNALNRSTRVFTGAHSVFFSEASPPAR